MRDSGMGQQLLTVPPQQLFAHLRFEFDLYRFEVLEPALGGDEGVIGAEEEAILQARGGLTQERFGNVAGGPARQAFNIYMFNTFTINRYRGTITSGTALPPGLMGMPLATREAVLDGV